MWRRRDCCNLWGSEGENRPAGACAPAELCCVDNGQACSSNTECCSYLGGVGYCITDTGTCQPTCTSDADCGAGCCLEVDVGSSVCAPADFCG